MTISATSRKKFKSGTLETFASLRISGDRLEPNRVTEVMCTAPTLAYRKGEVYKHSRGHEVRGRTGLWLISSEEKVESLDLNDHLDYLLTIVFPLGAEGRLLPLQKLMHNDGLEADVPCFWHGKHGAKPPVIRKDIRDRLALIPAEIETDFDTD